MRERNIESIGLAPPPGSAIPLPADPGARVCAAVLSALTIRVVDAPVFGALRLPRATAGAPAVCAEAPPGGWLLTCPVPPPVPALPPDPVLGVRS